MLAQQVALVFNFLTHFDPVQARYVGPEMQQLLTWLANYYEYARDVRTPQTLPTVLD